MPWHPLHPDEAPTLGQVAIEWIESTLRFTDGPKSGQPITLYGEQKMHLLHRAQLDPHATEADGNEAFVRRGSMLVRGQKWGKDPLLAMVDLFHAFGPCDFAGWDANGRPVGKPHPSPWVFVAALNEKQTDNTWIPLREMVLASDLVDISGVEVNLDQVRLPCGNPIEPLTTSAWGRLGGRFTAGSLTENGVMTDTVAGAAAGAGKRSPLTFARTIIRSVTGMGGMWIAATNTWDPTEHSHAQRIYESKPKTVYIDAKISRGRVDIGDDEALRDELLYLYGDSSRDVGGHVSTKSLIDDCRDVEMHGESEIRRFFLSEILAGTRPLTDPAVWASLAVPGVLEPKTKISLGFDGSRARDATVLTACRLSDGRLFHLNTWLPVCRCTEPRHAADECPIKRIDRTAVDTTVRAAFAAYDVHFLYADPYKWQDYLDRWSGDFETKLDGRKHQPVVELATNEERRIDRVVNRFLNALTNGELSHDGNTDLAEHINNAAVAKGRRKEAREDEEGARIEYYRKVVKKREGLLIDAAISAMLAYEARGQAIDDGGLVVSEELVPFFILDDD